MGVFDFEGDAKIFSKAQSPLRWFILLLSCLMMIGNYYCYDNPAALKSQIDDHMGDPSDFETMYSLLYTVYSIPNVILPFFGGFFVDKLGVRLCLLIFTGFILVGQVVFSIGLSAKSWPIMYVGRVLYGFGGESLSVGNSAVLAQWFAGKELAFAFGLNLSIARLGSVINNLVSPQLAKADGVVFALWFGVFVCAMSFGCSLLIVPIDKGMDLVLERSEAMRAPLLGAADEADDEQDLEGDENSITGLNSTKGGNKNSTDTGGRMSSAEKRGRSSNENKAEDGLAVENNDVNIWEVLNFITPFWVLTLSCVVVYGCVLPFNNIASTLLLERDYFMEQPNSACALTYDAPGSCQNATNVPNQYCNNGEYYQPPLAQDASVDCDNDPTGCYTDYCDGQNAGTVEATTVMSIPYIISACLSPVLGGFVDKFGMRAIISTIAPLTLLIVHSLLGYTDVSPIGPLVGQGLAYSGFAAVLWPSIPLVVEPKYIGLGYGFVTAVQNIGLACFPLIIAQIYIDSGEKYIPNVELFFMMLALGGTVVGLYLNYYDYYHGHIFNSPGKPIIVVEDGDEEDKLAGGDGSGTGHGPSVTVINSLRQVSGDAGATGEDGAGIRKSTGAGTFTSHEELYRARIASGDIPVVTAGGRSLSRSRDRQRSSDVAALQKAYNPLLQGDNKK